jgi:hypothetical protein
MESKSKQSVEMLVLAVLLMAVTAAMSFQPGVGTAGKAGSFTQAATLHLEK